MTLKGRKEWFKNSDSQHICWIKNSNTPKNLFWEQLQLGTNGICTLRQYCIMFLFLKGFICRCLHGLFSFCPILTYLLCKSPGNITSIIKCRGYGSSNLIGDIRKVPISIKYFFHFCYTLTLCHIFSAETSCLNCTEDFLFYL